MRGGWCVVTGASGGIGLEVARGLLQEGASVVLACRDEEKAAKALEQLASAAAAGGGAVEAAQLDVSDTRSVHAFVKSWRESRRLLRVLVNNAGVMGQLPEMRMPFAKNTFPYHFGEDAFERMVEYDPALSINHLGPFLLTHELFLAEGGAAVEANARVVNVASDAHARGEVNFEGGRLVTTQRWSRRLGRFHDDWYKAYARSKLCNMLMTVVFNKRMFEAGRSNCALAASPGRCKTDLQRHIDQHRSGVLRALAPLTSRFQSAEEGAKTVVWACCGAELCADGPKMTHYLEGMKEGWAAEDAGDLENGERLWDWSRKVMGIDFEFSAGVSAATHPAELMEVRDPQTGLFFEPRATEQGSGDNSYTPVDWNALDAEEEKEGMVDTTLRR